MFRNYEEKEFTCHSTLRWEPARHTHMSKIAADPVYVYETYNSDPEMNDNISKRGYLMLKMMEPLQRLLAVVYSQIHKCRVPL